MAENKQDKKPTGYFVGEVPTQVDQVVATPDGNPMTDKQALAEILNKLDALYKLIKENF